MVTWFSGHKLFCHHRRRGPDANQLQRENRLMRDQLDRCMKENTVLRGLHMQSKNTTLKKLQKQHDMEGRHSCLSFRRRTPAGSMYTDDSSTMSSGYASTKSSRSKVGGRSVTFSPSPSSFR